MQIQKFKRGAAQTGLLLEDFDQLYIPVFGNAFQKKTSQLVHQIYERMQQAIVAYENAEHQLNNAIGCEAEISEKATSEKTLKNSFKVTGRLDAEYYQEKYEKYIESLHTGETVGSLCRIYDQTFLPKEDIDYRYIELSNVGNAGEISNADVINGAELPSRARRKVKTGQIVISSVEGSLKSCALVTNDFDECLCSTGFYVLDSEHINPETLLVLFKSEAIQALMKQHCSGTILAGITKDELLSMPLPKIGETLQKDIAGKVQESFALRQQSKQLLEYAKQAVEMAIEQGEVTALAWLKDKISASEG